MYQSEIWDMKWYGKCYRLDLSTGKAKFTLNINDILPTLHKGEISPLEKKLFHFNN